MIAFVIALKSEAKPLLDVAENLQPITLLDKPTYKCTLFNKECVLAVSGIGKVSAALTTQKLIDEFSPKYVINVGTCGGTNDSVKILNYYLADKCCQFDFDLREIDDVPLGYIQEYDRVFFPTFLPYEEALPITTLASSDRFSSKQIDIDDVNQMGCSIRDMEGGAVAQVCLSNNVKFIALKGITDVTGSGNDGEQFVRNLQTVVKGFPSAVEKLLKTI